MFSWGKGTVFLSPEKVSFRALFGVNRMKGKKCCLLAPLLDTYIVACRTIRNDTIGTSHLQDDGGSIRPGV